ncbi:unnamed protein product (macronuclear) [Paramecium tetraurelia]|uniref:Ricin B lectin domain-containing protein n=1 Tax=Paramecium tetraurelia TaxID=5888 RepID=A0C7A1_PARTE|nr:uncharacterized protein GSPATT00035798001 [Paramecium tetraurelia]CAK66668.1 unnamed protein product [Paramecium tetraurelia]|eukprot:XP_001434065.1 hypothetical protein (macronuclear) [Paramecium tetraurelia strain d4-2]
MKVKRNNWKIHSIGYKLGKSEKIGGGQYDDKGNQIGMWVEQRNEFNQFKYSQYNSWNQSTFKGVYNNQGVKQGRWDIFWNWNGENTKMYLQYDQNKIIAVEACMMIVDVKQEIGQKKKMGFICNYIVNLINKLQQIPIIWRIYQWIQIGYMGREQIAMKNDILNQNKHYPNNKILNFQIMCCHPHYYNQIWHVENIFISNLQLFQPQLIFEESTILLYANKTFLNFDFIKSSIFSFKLSRENKKLKKNDM